eukprot:15453323-Alexandrium_andersonii.AAC.1
MSPWWRTAGDGTTRDGNMKDDSRPSGNLQALFRKLSKPLRKLSGSFQAHLQKPSRTIQEVLRWCVCVWE